MRKLFGTKLALGALIVITAAVGTSVYLVHSARQRETAATLAVAAGSSTPSPAPAPDTVADIIVQRGANWSDILEDLEIDPDTAQKITVAAEPVFNFRQLQQGSKVTLTRAADGMIKSLLYPIDFDHELWISPSGDGFLAQVKQVPSTVHTVGIAGEVQGSLFESVVDAGEGPELALRIAEIFAWDLDFYTDPRPGDTFRVIIEKKVYDNGAPPAYGKILAAEYDNAGKKFDAIFFQDQTGKPAYYDVNGNSLQKAFLRSPLKFAARISSRFSRARFHPVLKIYRPHLGTDYAAPTGTPVQAIAGGRVVFSGYQGGGGNTVRLQHTNGYETYYMHLSKRLVRTGQRVTQGQRIGLVGSTGLSTGPHLDFRIRRKGAFVNFERMKLPPDTPVSRRNLTAFKAERDRWLPMLVALSPKKPATEVAGVQGTSGEPGSESSGTKTQLAPAGR
ncbi:MAG TPA: peptidoglycan DD-metalloendopeptidase family protein [Terriglobales bacterium]|nr:peptidoglycan DD-metalloendopeptidase family protein [Terriglobales bacterium]